MGLFGKIKGILFEDEEEVETSKTSKPVNKDIEERISFEEKEEVKIKKPMLFDFDEEEEEAKPQVKVTKQEEPQSERELFSNNKFNFPAFDEDEFESTLPKRKPLLDDDEGDYVHETKLDTRDRDRSPYFERDRERNIERNINHDREKPQDTYTKPRDTRDYRDIRINTTKKPEYSYPDKPEEKKKFKLSPIISPVFGILDKDYQKDDILPKKKEDDILRKEITIESVRKKAFGSLEDDIEETMSKPKEIEKTVPKKLAIQEDDDTDLDIGEPKKDINELLRETAHEEVIVPKDLEDNSKTTIEDIEEELEKYDEVEEAKEQEEKESEMLEQLDKTAKELDDDDTLEQDLFELIDSMYDDRKGGDE